MGPSAQHPGSSSHRLIHHLPGPPGGSHGDHRTDIRAVIAGITSPKRGNPAADQGERGVIDIIMQEHPLDRDTDLAGIGESPGDDP